MLMGLSSQVIGRGRLGRWQGMLKELS
ncbi:hypothetical protein HU200_011989 [Digitaria exilis]|uniref:Uncharacterized protein n=1 Tax=Digitaria exilis TaxID=1010633 RepID=A0A835FFT0_9POAL|nr:hypothetical protein HU200_011989 [Digitaria exilis]